MLTLAALLMLQTAPAAGAPPSARAEELGRQVAQAGTLGQLAPLLVARDIAELIAAHPELSPVDQARLRATADAVARAHIDRLLAAEGHAYARAMSEDDLSLIAFFEASDAARRRRAALPQVIIGTMTALGDVDFKTDAIAAFCAETGNACPTP